MGCKKKFLFIDGGCVQGSRVDSCPNGLWKDDLGTCVLGHIFLTKSTNILALIKLNRWWFNFSKSIVLISFSMFWVFSYVIWILSSSMVLQCCSWPSSRTLSVSCIVPIHSIGNISLIFLGWPKARLMRVWFESMLASWHIGSMSNLIFLRRDVVTDSSDFLFTVRAIGDDWRYSCGFRAWYGVFEKGGESSTDKAANTRPF